MFIVIIFLSYFIAKTTASTCAASVTNKNAIYQVQDTFLSAASVSTFSAVPGPVSNALYYLYDYTPGEAVIRKVNSDDTLAWMACLLFDSIQKSLTVDSTESKVYVGVNNSPFDVVNLNANTGAVSSTQRFTNIDSMNKDVKIMVLSTGLGYYFAATCSVDTLTYLCKYLFSSTTTASCQKITTMDVIAYGQLRINDNQLFLIGNEPLSTYHLQYYKITFGNTAVDWANKILCASGSCSASNSESLLSSDNSLIYTFATFGSTQYLYFITFSTSTGSVVGSRYKSSSTCTGAWKAVLNQY